LKVHPTDTPLGDWPDTKEGHDKADEVLHDMAAKVKNLGKAENFRVYKIVKKFPRDVGGFEDRCAVYLRDHEALSKSKEEKNGKRSGNAELPGK
jgi:hypothetical protein